MSRGKQWAAIEKKKKKDKAAPLGIHSTTITQEPLPLFCSAAQGDTVNHNFRQAAAKLFHCKKMPGRIHLHFLEKYLKHRRLSEHKEPVFYSKVAKHRNQLPS